MESCIRYNFVECLNLRYISVNNIFCWHYSYFQEYLKNIKFNYKNELVLFDANGDPPGHYDIMNFQQVGNNSMEYVADMEQWNS